MYAVHPSAELNRLFTAKPYQGAVPEEAKLMFVGLDANYSPDIETMSVFDAIREYHADGVAFWRKYGVHHPFLLDNYKGDGRRYHRNFAKIGFGPEHAADISFIELLHLPTVGRNSLLAADLNTSHLARLSRAILEGCAQHVFVSNDVAKLLRKATPFRWFPKELTGLRNPLGTLFQKSGKTIHLHLHLHFSNYGKFELQMREEAAAIRALI